MSDCKVLKRSVSSSNVFFVRRSNGIPYVYCGTGNPPLTATPTPTQTPTQTATQTPTPTQTATQTPTQTATQTPTQTATQTPTQTPTPTPTSISSPKDELIIVQHNSENLANWNLKAEWSPE